MIINELRKQIQELKLNSINPELIIISKDKEREMFLDGSFEKSKQINESIRIDNVEYSLIVKDEGEIKVYGRELFTRWPIKYHNTEKKYMF